MSKRAKRHRHKHLRSRCIRNENIAQWLSFCFLQKNISKRNFKSFYIFSGLLCFYVTSCPIPHLHTYVCYTWSIKLYYYYFLYYSTIVALRTPLSENSGYAHVLTWTETKCGTNTVQCTCRNRRYLQEAWLHEGYARSLLLSHLRPTWSVFRKKVTPKFKSL